MTDADRVLAPSFDQEVEWTAFVAQTRRVIQKRDGGQKLTKADNALLTAYRAALELKDVPKHHTTGDTLPPVLRGYNEAVAAFNVTRGQLYGLRKRGSPAFHGNAIYTACLVADLTREPNPEEVAPNLVHSGRKSILTPALTESICKGLAKCPVLSIVAQAHGITGATLTIWRNKGAQGEKKYVEFFNRSEEVIAVRTGALVADIADNPDWRAKLAIVERINNKMCKTTSVEVSGPQGGAIVTKGDGPPAPVIIQLQGLAGPNIYDPATPQTEEEIVDETGPKTAGQ